MKVADETKNLRPPPDEMIFNIQTIYFLNFQWMSEVHKNLYWKIIYYKQIDLIYITVQIIVYTLENPTFLHFRI